METVTTTFNEDIAAIGRISAVPLILEMICKSTGMGFAAVARVTPEQWIACSVKDDIMFGLMPGGELKVDTTICHEIRQSGDPVVIDHVAKDEFYAHHHTPAMYGLQSYISVPIIRQNGYFFGTLCAIDPNPAILNVPEIIGMFKTYASLIAFHLNADELESAEQALASKQHTVSVLRQQLATVFGHPQSSLPGTSASSSDPQLIVSMDRKQTYFYGILDQSMNVVRRLLRELH